MKILTSTISILTLLTSTILIANPITAQSIRTADTTNISPAISQPEPTRNNSLKINSNSGETTKGETATCKGGLRNCQKFISACEAGKGGVTYGGADKSTNIPQEFTCTLP